MQEFFMSASALVFYIFPVFYFLFWKLEGVKLIYFKKENFKKNAKEIK